jgi:hypothetical protein
VRSHISSIARCSFAPAATPSSGSSLIRPGGQPAASLVTIRLDEYPEGTMLHLSHAFDDVAACDAHVPGWRSQLSVFANRVSDIVLARASTCSTSMRTTASPR